MHRPALVLLLLTGAPDFASGQQCASPTPIATASAIPPRAAPSLDQRVPTSSLPVLAPSLSGDLAALPFVKHVADAGATILDLGSTHGLRLIGARSGAEFRVFAVLPEGQAAVEGAPVALSVEQLQKLAGGAATPLPPRSGMTGFFVRSGRRFQVFYAAPDGQVVVPGILRSADGKDITREQVRDIPGVVPTVEVRDDASGRPDAQPASATDADAALQLLSQATFGIVGPDSAPEVFMVIDPQCIYSVRAYQQLRGYAESGKIRLAVLPVAILDHEDEGQSTRSALALLSKRPSEIPIAWQAGDVNGAVSAQARDLLQRNMALTDAIG